MEERGILSREACQEKRVDWRGSKLVGERICGSPVPKGVAQLPRPAIIRMSGVTISVNVPDSEPRNPSKAKLAKGIARRERPPIPSPLASAPSRNIVRYTLTRPPTAYLVIHISSFDPMRYLDYGCTHCNFQVFIEYLVCRTVWKHVVGKHSIIMPL